jgi:hypothetical protein
MADDGHEGGWIMAGRPEEYLLYVRVPDPEDEQLDTTSGFLERLARLLNDEDAKIYVEDYRTYVEGEQHTHGRHGDGELDADELARQPQEELAPAAVLLPQQVLEAGQKPGPAPRLLRRLHRDTMRNRLSAFGPAG